MDKPIIIRAADVEGEYREPPRVSRLLLAEKSVGSQNASMGLNITEMGSMIPDHVHADSEEFMYVVSGNARLVIEGGDAVYEIGPDTAIYVPVGMTHRLENIGDSELKLIWVYAPQLPHHRK